MFLLNRSVHNAVQDLLLTYDVEDQDRNQRKDYRNSALVLRGHDESECCDLRYAGYEIREGKYELEGLPAVYAGEKEAQTLKIVLEDNVSRVRVQLDNEKDHSAVPSAHASGQTDPAPPHRENSRCRQRPYRSSPRYSPWCSSQQECREMAAARRDLCPGRCW